MVIAVVVVCPIFYPSNRMMAILHNMISEINLCFRAFCNVCKIDKCFHMIPEFQVYARGTEIALFEVSIVYHCVTNR